MPRPQFCRLLHSAAPAPGLWWCQASWDCLTRVLPPISAFDHVSTALEIRNLYISTDVSVFKQIQSTILEFIQKLKLGIFKKTWISQLSSYGILWEGKLPHAVNTSQFMENLLNSTNVELNCPLCSKHCCGESQRRARQGPNPPGTLSSWEDETDTCEIGK